MDVDGVEDLRPNKKAVVYGEVRLLPFSEVLVTAALFEKLTNSAPYVQKYVCLTFC